ncbi:MAG: DUF1343 domain-containing protein [Opitutae bacterium]|nr:DUF1343 domain-containing protein [Opitutae bacterium]
MLGIDVLEATRFEAITGKKIGLLTHQAGVNRRGESSIDVLRRSPYSKLVALFSPEHGLNGTVKAGENVADSIDPRSGLPVYSLHGKNRRPTKAQLKNLDALVIDLQDIGVRSYTFSAVMRYAMEACFENGVEVIVLDRPNPLGGLKVDGPPLDPEWMSGVGAFRVPYVHGLTMGELATMAKEAPGVLAVSEKNRQRGKLTVVPMRGWTRAMRWPETGLTWVPTSPNIPSFDAVIGYAMVGLGCQESGWTWGIGKDFAFRGIGFPKKTPDEIIRAMSAYRIPGLSFVKRPGLARDGKMITGVYVEITDWEKWHPTELSFYMHRQAAAWSALNPFAAFTTAEQRSFNIHVGSTAWLAALRREGARVDVGSFLRNWRARAEIYQQASRKYWLYR